MIYKTSELDVDDVLGNENNDGEINCYSTSISVRQVRDYIVYILCI